MNWKKQWEVIDNFRSEKCKILLATSIVEEGIDISTCHTVILFDKIYTPKSFVQMKGRARRDDAQVIFFAENNEELNIKQEQETYQAYI